jgi:hypothetical protein
MILSLDRQRGAIEKTFRGRQAVRAYREHLKRVVDTLPE